MQNRIPCQRDAGTRLAMALRRCPFSTCNKGNRRRLHAERRKKEGDSKSNNAMSCLFCCDLHLTIVFSGLYCKICLKEDKVWQKLFSNNSCCACHTSFDVFSTVLLHTCSLLKQYRAWRTLLVYTAKNLTSFGSYELIKTQIASIFGKKLKFINRFSLNIFFLAVRPK